MTCDKMPSRRPLLLPLKLNVAESIKVGQQMKTPLSNIPPSDIACPICCCCYTSGIRRPKRLQNCSHTFCAPCLETLGTGIVKCPLCRHETVIRDIRSLSDDMDMLRRVTTSERLYPQLSPLKPPPPTARLRYDAMPDTPVKTRREIPQSALRPPAWNPDFTQKQPSDRRRAKTCPAQDSRKRAASSPRYRPSKPDAPTRCSPVAAKDNKSLCSECGYRGLHSPSKCATSASEYFTAPDYPSTTDFTSDESLSSLESLGSAGESTISGVWRTNSLPSKRRRKRYISANTPLSNMGKQVSKKLRRRSAGETANMEAGCQSGELCSLRLVNVMGEFSTSPNTPGSFRKPSHVTISRFNNHVAVVDSVYATVQIFNETGSKSITMIDLLGVTASCFVSADTIVCSNHLGITVYNYTSTSTPQVKRQTALSDCVALSPYRGDATHEGAFIAVQSKCITVFSGSKLRTLIEIRRRLYPKRVFRKQVPFRTLVDCTSTSHGDLIALDSKTAKLYLMDRRGRVLLCIESRKELCGRFVNPQSVSVDMFDDLYVTDKDRVLKFSAQGLFSRTVLRVTGHLTPTAITTSVDKYSKQCAGKLLVAMCGEQKSQAHVRIYSI